MEQELTEYKSSVRTGLIAGTWSFLVIVVWGSFVAYLIATKYVPQDLNVLGKALTQLCIGSFFSCVFFTVISIRLTR